MIDILREWWLWPVSLAFAFGVGYAVQRRVDRARTDERQNDRREVRA
ncbi:MAG: hypothetical protein KDC38_16310 [Planctomycetes bacterium]|nr:hypothetical protein [Planctomycetota bacterium]